MWTEFCNTLFIAQKNVKSQHLTRRICNSRQLNVLVQNENILRAGTQSELASCVLYAMTKAKPLVRLNFRPLVRLNFRPLVRLNFCPLVRLNFRPLELPSSRPLGLSSFHLIDITFSCFLDLSISRRHVLSFS